MVCFSHLIRIILLVTALVSCSADSFKENSDSRRSQDSETEQKKDEQESEETGTDVPADVTALFLSLDCKSTAATQDIGRYELICRIANKAGEFLIPTDFALNYAWSVAGDGLSSSNTSITETQDVSGYAVKIVIGKDQYVKASILTEVSIKLDYVEKVTNIPGSVSKRIDTIYAGLANQRYVRFTILSIKDHSNTEAIQFLNKISVNIDGQWLDLTINQTTNALSLGTMAVGSNGVFADGALILNVLGKNDPVLPATAFSRFNGNSAFDAAEPLYLVFGNGSPTSITGLRYNDGQPIASRNIAAGFPDEFQFETSPDNINWTPVKDSRIKIGTINDEDQFDFVWNGSEAN
jgi:hypothetical protein